MTVRAWPLLALLAATTLSAQQPKNVKILTGMSRPEVQRVMNLMRAGLGVHCHYCHVTGQDPSVDATPQKAKARETMRMVVDLNQRHFGGREVVTCFTCHNGSPRPAQLPPLPQPVPPDLPAPSPVAETKPVPTPAEILSRYVAAVGRIIPAGEPRTTVLTRVTPASGPLAMKVFESGDQYRVDVTLPDGTPVTQVLTANGGWIRDKQGVRDMGPDEVISARMGRRAFAPFTETSFPAGAAVVSDQIGDQKVWVVVTPNARYSFDAETGFLLRRVVFFSSPLGRIPEQIEFDHYRDAGGVKVPFTTRVALVDPWLGGSRLTTSVVVGKPIDPAEFEKPD